jgi:hypothetical protein
MQESTRKSEISCALYMRYSSSYKNCKSEIIYIHGCLQCVKMIARTNYSGHDDYLQIHGIHKFLILLTIIEGDGQTTDQNHRKPWIIGITKWFGIPFMFPLTWKILQFQTSSLKQSELHADSFSWADRWVLDRAYTICIGLWQILDRWPFIPHL